jgi:hypothetical protein
VSENETRSEGLPLRARTIGVVFGDCGGDRIAIEHVFAPEGAFECDDCGEPGHDPGMVGLGVSGDDRQNAYAMLSPEEALLIANRLTRAAGLVLESMEDVPDVEREAARFAVPDDASAAEDPEEAAFIRTKQIFQDVCDAWNEVPEGHPSPVKKVARDLGMSAADVAEIIFPPEEFGPWSDSQEPDLP